MSANDPNLSDAEKMRLKRLARLGGSVSQEPRAASPQTPSEEQAGSGSSTPHVPPSSASRLLSQAIPSPARVPSPAAKPTASPAPKATPAPAPATPKATPSPKPTAPSGPSRSSSTSTPVQSKPRPAAASPVKPTQSYADWEALAVGKVFNVTLDKLEAEASDWKKTWLKELRGEMQEENPAATPTVSLDSRDRLLIARLSLDPTSMASSDDPDQLTVLAGMPEGETVFEYLTGCWKRLNGVNREMSRLGYSKEEKAKWHEAANELKRLVISYSGMTLEDPTMFPQPADKPVGPAEFLPLLLGVSGTGAAGDPLTSSAPQPVVQRNPNALAPTDLLPFLNDLATGFPEGGMADVITPTLSLFFQEWFKITPTPDLLGQDWQKYLGAMTLLVQVKAIAALLPSLPIWVAPNVDAAKLEWQSLLGPLTRLSVFPREFPQIWKTYFSNPTERKTADIDANKSNLRHGLGALQNGLFTLYNAIVRASPESREGALDFFAKVVALNVKRAGSHVDYRTVSSDGFMINLQYVLLKLFEPVMDFNYSKIDKVDPEYYRHSKRLDVSEETKIHAEKAEADEYFGHVMDTDSKPGFIPDIFYLLNHIHHLGTIKTIGTRTKLERNISDIEKELKRLEAMRGQWAGNPTAEAQGEAAIKKYKGDLATIHASIHAYDTQLLDPAMVRLNVTFCGFLMNWLLRMVDPEHAHPQKPISLPLSPVSPVQFRMLPEFFFENVVEYYDFLARYSPDTLDDADKDTLITFAIAFVNPTHVNNPFLKAKLVAALANGLYPVGYWRKGPLFDRLSTHPQSTAHLMPMIIRFWIDVESTGGHTQFWDKFNFRRDLSRILKSMWTNPLHREAFVKSRHDNLDQFIKFVNMLMSDTTFHLEESLTNLAAVHSLRAEKEDEEAWNAKTQAEKEDTESQLRQAEQSAPYHTHMGLDHIELIRDITATEKEPFLVGEIVDRLTASLDESLATLVGPKMQELKLKDPERFGFKPKQLLAALAQIYLNLGSEQDFIRAVANDGRSYSKELFERFARILKNRAIMTDGEVQEIIAFTQRVEDAKATIEIEDEREIPDEFLDPLLATLMKDPVILPVSRVTVDRSTIRAALLSKELDPFNNVPLKYEDVIPNDELKAQIDEWVAQGKGAKPQEVKMDLDE